MRAPQARDGRTCFRRLAFGSQSVAQSNGGNGADFVRPQIYRSDVQKRANAVLALLPLTVTPDLSASTLGIRNGATGDPSLSMILGFNQLTSLGAGIEIDTGAVTKLFSRLRMVARYAFGKDVTGASLGLALSF
ncbi:hypothetical protein LMG27952_05254 [Paraburkholderia hiiakae]|uniref:Autotransporter domain-containing protein n=1 Tax=Paraburkholderia hiiakae TaxID=1081782 RepID=A0ABN7I7J7_9BURK|nr:hypothetical protein LMG27952_05254 [Paraburkholderia hiiakae]